MRYTDTIGETHTLVVPASEAGRRLDQFLASVLPDLSRSMIRTFIDRDLVTLSSGRVKPSAKVRPGDTVTLDVPEPVEMSADPEAIPLSILYEDASLVVVDKPAGLVVHPSPGHESGTLVNALLHHCRDLSGIGGELRPGIVHRLDRDTTGCIVCAKTDTAHRNLSAQFAARTTAKRYLALTHGVPRPPVGRIEGGMGRHPRHRQRQALLPVGGRHSLTEYRTLEAFNNYALVECLLHTGRTHQIRVHLKSVHAPILCDAEYGRESSVTEGVLRDSTGGAAMLVRQGLHAADLAFDHPVTGERMSFSSPLPADMDAVLAILRAGSGS